MVKVLYLGLFAAIVCALVALTLAVPVGSTISRNSSSDVSYHQHQHHHHHHHHHHTKAQDQVIILSDDGAVRSERSTNLSHITGSARKIQMYVKNRHLQILPDGTVNGTSDDTSDYTILQRTTVSIGQLKIQGVATCQYLCMDSCGRLYGSKEFVDECLFNEMIEQHHYNTYSSARYSNARRTMYLALNGRGEPRKVQIRAHQQLGKLSVYTRVLTKHVNIERVEELLARLLHTTTTSSGSSSSSSSLGSTVAGSGSGSSSSGSSSSETSSQHPLRHHGGHLCATVVTSTGTSTSTTLNAALDQRINKNNPIVSSVGDAAPGIDRLRCRKRKKRKKKRRKCLDGDDEGCMKKSGGEKNVRKNTNNNNNNNNNNKLKKCEHDKNKKICQRLEKGELVTIKKKRRQKLGGKQLNRLRGARRREKMTLRNKKNVKKVLVVTRNPDEITERNTDTPPQSSSYMDEEYTASTMASESMEENSSSWDELTTTTTTTLTTIQTEDSEQMYDEPTSAAVSEPVPFTSSSSSLPTD